MSDISKNAKCSKSYTAHCLRATAIQGMNYAGLEIRHIMHMSGHKNESLIRSCNRYCSTAQKKMMSDTLSGLTVNHVHNPLAVIPHTAQNPESFRQDDHESAPVSTSTIPGVVSLQSSHFLLSGLMSSSTFNNCVLKFEK